MKLQDYHRATNHSLESVWADRHTLDWPNQPLPFKIYTTLAPIQLPTAFTRSEVDALSALGGACPAGAGGVGLEAIARVCYFSNGITRILHGMPFRAAACTGALYHIELYVIAGELDRLEAGVYHYSAHDHALRLLRRGDFRRVVVAATGDEPSAAQAPAIVAFTSTWWRNAWKYQSRAYRHAFWDSGTILANFLAVACAQSLPARVVLGFADAEINGLLDVNPTHEATIALVSLGCGSSTAAEAPSFGPLNLPTRQLSAHEVAYPAIVEAHTASSLLAGEDAAAWRSRHSRQAALPLDVAERSGQSIEATILRRGSSRRFSHAPISSEQLKVMLDVATAPIDSDAHVPTEPYIIVNAVEGVPAGSYVYNRASRALELLRAGDFRREAEHLDLSQELAGDAALNVYWLADIAALDDRAYRAAQLAAATEGGKLYLAAYALGLGATGLTFFDDDVVRFFSPHAADKSVMFLTAVGHPLRLRGVP